MWRTLAIVAAVMFHVAILLFGGLIFGAKKEDLGTTRQVDLLSSAEDEAAKQKKKDEQPATNEKPAEEAVEKNEEDVPDLAEVLKDLETPQPMGAPALEAASLSAIEAALFGGGGGDSAGFGSSLSFASGGVIGGTGKVGALEQKAKQAFDMNEIDQRPREIFKAAPNYPSEMRGKKVEGVVTLIFVVDESGKVTDPKVTSSSQQAFEKPALQALKQWRFEPGVRGGKRVPCRMRVSIRFSPSA